MHHSGPASTFRWTAATALAAPANATPNQANFDGGDYIEDALTEQEFAQGYALACQMRPKTDLVISIAASSERCRIKSQNFNATPEWRSRGCRRPRDRLLRCREAASASVFLPGQYVNVRVPGTDQRRSYSFSSAPGAADIIIPGA